MIITTSLVWEISDLANLKKEVFMEIVGAADGGGSGVSPNARLMQPNVIFMCCIALHCIELHCELLWWFSGVSPNAHLMGGRQQGGAQPRNPLLHSAQCTMQFTIHFILQCNAHFCTLSINCPGCILKFTEIHHPVLQYTIHRPLHIFLHQTIIQTTALWIGAFKGVVHCNVEGGARRTYWECAETASDSLNCSEISTK